MQELAAMDEIKLAAVKNFAVRRPGFGAVEWSGTVDVRGVTVGIDVMISDMASDDSAETPSSNPHPTLIQSSFNPHPTSFNPHSTLIRPSFDPH